MLKRSTICSTGQKRRQAAALQGALSRAKSIRNSDSSREHANAFDVDDRQSKVKLPRGESNSRPTPNAFGAALLGVVLASKLSQIIDRNLWIFFCFQCALNPPRLGQCCDLLTCDDFDIFAKPLSCVRMTAQVLRKAGIKINCRANVMSTVVCSKYINPRHTQYARGESRTPDQPRKLSGLLYCRK